MVFGKSQEIESFDSLNVGSMALTYFWKLWISFKLSWNVSRQNFSHSEVLKTAFQLSDFIRNPAYNFYLCALKFISLLNWAQFRRPKIENLSTHKTEFFHRLINRVRFSCYLTEDLKHAWKFSPRPDLKKKTQNKYQIFEDPTQISKFWKQPWMNFKSLTNPLLRL